MLLKGYEDLSKLVCEFRHTDMTEFMKTLRFSVHGRLMNLLERRFERKYGVDTGGRLSPAQLGLEGKGRNDARFYHGTHPAILRWVIAPLPRDLSEFTFIDFGSGKGSALILASSYNLRRIVGVELSDDLIAIARSNLARYSNPKQQCHDISIVEMDAAEFEIPDEMCVLYFFNPFGKYTLQLIADNLAHSLERQPRKVYIIYGNPIHAEVFDALVGLAPMDARRGSRMRKLLTPYWNTKFYESIVD